MKHFRTFVVVVLLFISFGCASRDVCEPVFHCPSVSETSDVRPWTDKEFCNNPEEFQFMIVSDRTGKNRPGIFKYAVDRINLLQPEFVICVGDLIQGYTKDVAKFTAQRNELDSIVDKFEMPFFYLPGNHDITNAEMSAEWHERYGCSYYHFLYKNTLFLCLNSEDPPHDHISEEQVNYMAEVLAENQDVRWTFVFIHKPLWARNADSNWDKFEPLLKDRNHTVFAGHNHRYRHEERNDQDYIILSTTGGGNDLRGIEAGRFDHVMWVTMTESEPKIANLMLDGIWDKNTLTAERDNILAPLNRGKHFQLTPLKTQEGRFVEGQSELSVTNPSDHPLVLRMNLSPGSGLTSDPKELNVTVKPGQTEIYPIRFKATEPIDPKSASDIFLNWTGAFKFGGTREMKGQGKLKLMINSN